MAAVEPSHVEFGKVLKAFLEHEGITAGEFANSVGIGSTVAYDMVKGHGPASMPKAANIARKLGIPADRLLLLWDGEITADEVESDAKTAAVGAWLLEHDDLTVDEIKDVLRVATAVANMVRARDRPSVAADAAL
jgi:plasmid maintenance system antidote protein VapI